MRKTAILLSSIILLSLNFTASAFEADFSAKIRGVNTENDKARVVATARFKSTNIQLDEAFTVAYTINGNSEIPIYSGSVTIISEATEVTVGNRNDGKITIKYDPETGVIKTRFVKKVTLDDGNNSYSISATSGDWVGNATINSSINTQEIVYPEQITIEGTAVSFGPPISISWVDITIAGVQVYSGNPDAESFSILVNTGLGADFQSNGEDIEIDLFGDFDGIPVAGNAIGSLNSNQTLYDFGNIFMDLVPQ